MHNVRPATDRKTNRWREGEGAYEEKDRLNNGQRTAKSFARQFKCVNAIWNSELRGNSLVS